MSCKLALALLLAASPAFAQPVDPPNLIDKTAQMISFDGVFGGSDTFRDILFAPNEFFTFGVSEEAVGASNAWIQKYDAQGVPVASVTYNDAFDNGNDLDQFHQAAFGPSGTLLAVGQTLQDQTTGGAGNILIQRYDANLTVIASTGVTSEGVNLQDIAQSVIFDQTQNEIFILGQVHTGPAGANNPYLSRWDTSLSNVFDSSSALPSGQPAFLRGGALDLGSGKLFAVGSVGTTDNEGFVGRYSTDTFTLEVSTSLSGSGAGSNQDIFDEVALDPQTGEVWVVGQILGAGNGDPIIVHYDANLTLIASTTILSPSAPDTFHDLAFYGPYIYAAGELDTGSGSEGFIAVFRKADAVMVDSFTWTGSGGSGTVFHSIDVVPGEPTQVVATGEVGNTGSKDAAFLVFEAPFLGPDLTGDKVWSGQGADNLASTPGNWEGGVTPVGGDYVVIGTSNTDKNVTWDIGAPVGSFTVSALYQATVTFGAAPTFTGSVFLEGGPASVVDFGSNTVVVTGSLKIKDQNIACLGCSISFNGTNESEIQKYGANIQTVNLPAINVQKSGAGVLRSKGPANFNGNFSVIGGTWIAGPYAHQFQGDVLQAGGQIDAFEAEFVLAGAGPQAVRKQGPGQTPLIAKVSVVGSSTKTFESLDISTLAVEGLTNPGQVLRISTNGAVTVISSTTLRGFPGSHVVVGSQFPGQPATFNLFGAKTLDFAHVSDIDGSGGPTWNPTNSIDGGNNINVFPAAGIEPMGFSGSPAVGFAIASANDQSEIGGVRYHQPTDTFYVLQTSSNGVLGDQPSYFSLFRFTSGGLLVASRTLANDDGSLDFELDPQGNVYVGQTLGFEPIWLTKYDPNLVLIASRALSAADIGGVSQIVVDGGFLYTGEDGTPGNTSAKFVRRSLLDLTEITTATFQFEASVNKVLSLEAGPNGTLFGRVEQDVSGADLLVRLSPATTDVAQSAFVDGLVGYDGASMAVTTFSVFAVSIDTGNAAASIAQFDWDLNFVAKTTVPHTGALALTAAAPAGDGTFIVVIASNGVTVRRFNESLASTVPTDHFSIQSAPLSLHVVTSTTVFVSGADDSGGDLDTVVKLVNVSTVIAAGGGGGGPSATLHVQITDISSPTAFQFFDNGFAKVRAWAEGGNLTLGALSVEMLGNAKPQDIGFEIWADTDADGLFDTGSDTFYDGNTPGGFPPKTTLSVNDSLTAGATYTYFINVYSAGGPTNVGVGVKISSADFSVGGSTVVVETGTPFLSSTATLLAPVPAKPSDAGASDPTSNTGGIEVFNGLQAGQNVLVQAFGQWDAGSGGVSAAGSGSCGPCTVSGAPLGELIGRIGTSASGSWFRIGVSSVIVAPAAGNLYLAANDNVWSDNSGVLGVHIGVQATTKTWTGSGATNDASEPANWQGNTAPADGDFVLVDTGNKTVAWNLPNKFIKQLTLGENYSGLFTLINPPPGSFPNHLVIEEGLFVRGGTFDLGSGQTVDLIQGGVIESSGTLDLGGNGSELVLGGDLIVRDTATLTHQTPQAAFIAPLDGPAQETRIDVSGRLRLITSSQTVIEHSQLRLFDGVSVEGLNNVKFVDVSTAIVLLVHSTRTFTFNAIGFEADVSTNVDASASTAPALTMNQAYGPRFGTPFEIDPFDVVSWTPDGGGLGDLTGTLNFSASSGTFVLAVSSDPKVDGQDILITTNAPGPFAFSNLPAPNTYFVFAFFDANDDGEPFGFEARATAGTNYSRSGSFIPPAGAIGFYVPNGGAAAGVGLTLGEVGGVAGPFTNASSQIGFHVAELWDGVPGLSTSTLMDRNDNGGTTFYYLVAPPATSYFSRGFIDVDGDRQWDPFEAVGSTGPFDVQAFADVVPAPLTPAGGSEVPGGTVTVTATPVLPGYLPATNFNSRLAYDILVHAVGADAKWGGLRVDAFGGAVASATFALTPDFNSNGQLEEFPPFNEYPVGPDLQIAPGKSSGTIQFYQAETIQAGTTRRFLLDVELDQAPFGSSIRIEIAETGFSFAQGGFFTDGGFPAGGFVTTVVSTARFVVPAYEYLPNATSGGTDTGLFVSPGQSVSVDAVAQWSFDNVNGVVGADGHASLTGGAVSNAKRGALIGRTGGGWFRIGASTTVVSNQPPGFLHLAMNDCFNCQFDNFGEALVDFQISGSTTGVAQGTVAYLGALTDTLAVEAVRFDTGGNPTIVASTAIAIVGGGDYAWSIADLPADFYDFQAHVAGSPQQEGKFGKTQFVQANSTRTGVDFPVYPGKGGISGSINYSGGADYGDYIIAVSTDPRFENIFLSTFQANAGPYAMGDLFAPASYYLVVFNDGNFDQQPEGPEPVGAITYGTVPVLGALADLPLQVRAISVEPGQTTAGQNVSMRDSGMIQGLVTVAGSLTAPGVGVRVSAVQVHPNGVFPENVSDPVDFVPSTTCGTNCQRFYNIGLLRPATSYRVVAWIDADYDRILDPGERFTFQDGITVTANSFPNVDLVIPTGPAVPAAPSTFTATASLVSEIDFQWQDVFGETGYQLLTSTGGVLYVLAADATGYKQVGIAAPNTASAVAGVRAVNGAGSGAVTSLAGAPVYTAAADPVTVTFSGLSASSVTVSWAPGANPAGTLYQVQRSTAGAGGPFSSVAVGTQSQFFEPALLPASTYFYRVRAVNFDGIPGIFSTPASTATLPASGNRLEGAVSYLGGQPGPFVLELSTDAFVSLAARVFAVDQTTAPYFAGSLDATTSYALRAFIDVDGDQVWDDGEDLYRSTFTFVPASPSVFDFSVARDTVAPAAPSNLQVFGEFKRNRLVFTAPGFDRDGSALDQFGTPPAGYLVERTTFGLTGPYTALNTVYSTATVFYDTAPLAGFNRYRVRAVDWGGNASNPTSASGATANLGGTISGTLTLKDNPSNTGQYHVRLSTRPDPTLAPLADQTISSTTPNYSFSGLQDGEYFVTAYRDLNSNSQNALDTEPGGALGGVARPLPVFISQGGTISGQNFAVCGRTALTPGTPGGATLTASSCVAADRGPGYYTEIFTFVVGNGPGKVPVGSQVEVFGFFDNAGPVDSYMYVLGPDGGVIAQDDNSAGANQPRVQLTMQAPGVHYVELTSFQSGQTGDIDVFLEVIGGFAGSIDGTVSYAGSASGKVHLQLFDRVDIFAFPIVVSTYAAPGAFSIPGIQDRPEYYLKAFLDANGNGFRDRHEPSGQYGLSDSSLTVISVQGGQASPSNIDLTLNDPVTGAIGGTLSYSGVNSGSMHVVVGLPDSDCFQNCGDRISEIVGKATLANSGGSYLINFLEPATNYIVNAFIDTNGDGARAVLESKVSSFPVQVTAFATTTYNASIQDHGSGAAGASTLRGGLAYGGSSTGSIFVGITSDPSFTFIDYTLSTGPVTAPGTYYFTKQSLVGNTSYYIAAFIDVNGNGQPETESAPGEALGFFGTLTPFDFSSQSALYIVNGATITNADVTLVDPPNGVMSGTITYSGSIDGDIFVDVNVDASGKHGEARVTRTAGISTYAYTVAFLPAAPDYKVRAFIDVNQNKRHDIGEPEGVFGSDFQGSGDAVSVSSGTGASEAKDINLFLYEPGQDIGSSGEMHGAVTYNGFVNGSVRVRVFKSSGTGVLPDRVDTAYTGGGTQFNFDIGGLETRSYFLDAFVDADGNGRLDPAFEPRGDINGGQSILLSEGAPRRDGLSGTILDLGQGGATGAASLTVSVSYGGTTFSSGTLRLSVHDQGASVKAIPIRTATGTVSGFTITFGDLPDPTSVIVRAFLDVNQNGVLDLTEPYAQSDPAGRGATSAGLTPPPLMLVEPAVAANIPGEYPVSVGSVDSIQGGPGAGDAALAFFAQRGETLDAQFVGTALADPFLTLLRPDGSQARDPFLDDNAHDNGIDAEFTGQSIDEDGIWRLVGSAARPGITGSGLLRFRKSSGQAGSISGQLNYTGTQGGGIFIGLFTRPNFGEPGAFFDGIELSSPSPFGFTNLPSGTTYYLGAFIDVNGNFQPDAGEDGGNYGGQTPSPIYLQSGRSVSGINFTITPSNDAFGPAGGGSVQGQVSYSGPQTGDVFIEFWPNSSFQGAPVAVRRLEAPDLSSSASFDLTLPGDQVFFPRAFLDADGNFFPSPGDPLGTYQPNQEGAEEIYVPAGGSVLGVDIALLDAGQRLGASGAAGQGRAELTVAAANAGAAYTTDLKFYPGETAIGVGGRVGFGRGFEFPPLQNANAGNPEYVTFFVEGSTGTFNFQSFGDHVELEVLTGSIVVNSTVAFSLSNGIAPCGVTGARTWFTASNTDPDTPPAPILAQPTFTVNPGAPAFVDFPNFQAALVAGATSSVAIQLRDDCGNAAKAASALPLQVVGRTFDFGTGLFSPEPAIEFSSTQAGPFLATNTVTFDTLQSSGIIVAYGSPTVNAGEKVMTVWSAGVQSGTPFFVPMVALSGTPIQNPNVSTGPFNTARSSVTITPDGDGVNDVAFVNFGIGDPGLPWKVVVSSIPLRPGVPAVAVWETYGLGAPALGQVAWDGTASPWLGGELQPSGAYFVRIQVGNLTHDSLRVDLSGAELSGKVVDGGVTPAAPLSGVSVQAFGTAGAGAATTGSDGTYKMPLPAGSYTVKFGKRDYLAVSSAATVSASGGTQHATLTRAPTLGLRASLLNGTTAPADRFGELSAKNTAGSVALFSKLRVAAGTTTVDDGGTFDFALNSFITRKRITFQLPSDTYTVVAAFPGYVGISTTVFVPSAGLDVILPGLTRRADIVGTVNLAANLAGLQVSLEARESAITTHTVARTFFLAPGDTNEAFSLQGLFPGTYTVFGAVQGLPRISTGPFAVGTADVNGVLVDFSAATQVEIKGALVITGDTSGSTPTIKVNAWSQSAGVSASTEVFLVGNAAATASTFTITGLTAGTTYQLFADVRADGEFRSEVRLPTSVFIAGGSTSVVRDLGFTRSSGVIEGTILLDPGLAGTVDKFGKVAMFGKTLASEDPAEQGKQFGVAYSTDLPNFLCFGGNAGDGTCLNDGVVQASFTVVGLGDQTIEVTFVDGATGNRDQKVLSVVSGSTTSVTIDLRGSTFSISGVIDNQVSAGAFNTNAEIAQNAAPYVPTGYPAGLPTTSARVEAIRRDFTNFGKAISTSSFDASRTRVGFIGSNGTYTITGLAPGVYLVRTLPLRVAATAAILVPSQEKAVTITTTSVRFSTITLSDGFNVSGSIALKDGLVDARRLGLKLFNRRQELVISTSVSLGNSGTGVTANAVSYALSGVPRGRFYTLQVSDLGTDSDSSAKYIAPPITFPDSSASSNGLQSDLAAQNVTLERAAGIIFKLRDVNSGRLIQAGNATLLAPTFRCFAEANPARQGGFTLARSSASGRPVEFDGTVRLSPLFAGSAYRVRCEQTTFDLNYLRQGSQNYAPVERGVDSLAAGQVRDLAVLDLNQGLSVGGRVVASTSAVLANVPVLALPSTKDLDLCVQSRSGADGRFNVWVSSAVETTWDFLFNVRGELLATVEERCSKEFFAEYRGAAEAAGELALRQETRRSPIDIGVVSDLGDVTLGKVESAIVGKIATADSGALRYPFGAERDFPAASINLQLDGTVGTNPLGDIAVRTAADGTFRAAGLSTGTYKVNVFSLGYATSKTTVALAGTTIDIGTVTLARGGTVKGSITKRNASGQIIYPSRDEARTVAAANQGFTEFVVGTTKIDPNTDLVTGYEISGFKPDVDYRIVVIDKDDSPDFPKGGDVRFSAAEANETKSLNLALTREAPKCTANVVITKNAVIPNEPVITISCGRDILDLPTGKQTEHAFLALSTFTSTNEAVASPNGTGSFPKGVVVQANRTGVRTIYQRATNEQKWSIRFKAKTKASDPSTGLPYQVDQVFDFYSGVAGAVEGKALNMKSGKLKLVSDDSAANDVNAAAFFTAAVGGAESGSSSGGSASIGWEPGTFVSTGSTTAGPEVNFKIGVRKASTLDQITAANRQADYKPQHLDMLERFEGLPDEIAEAMKVYTNITSKGAQAQGARTQGSRPGASNGAGAVKALSAFYDIFLPASVRHGLKKNATLTLNYDLSGTTVTSINDLNIWFYNTITKSYELESLNKKIDEQNKTISASVDHFSTFAVLASTPVLTSTTSFTGSEITAFNFPNPFNLKSKTRSANNTPGSGSFGSGDTLPATEGTYFRIGVPAGISGDASIKIYNVAGELVSDTTIGGIDTRSTSTGCTTGAGCWYYSSWDGRNSSGEFVASGVYFAVVKVGDLKAKTFKMTVIKDAQYQ